MNRAPARADTGVGPYKSCGGHRGPPHRDLSHGSGATTSAKATAVRRSLTRRRMNRAPARADTGVGPYESCGGHRGPPLAIWLRHGDRDRVGVDIQTQKSYLAHDRLPSYVALHCAVLQLAA